MVRQIIDEIESCLAGRSGRRIHNLLTRMGARHLPAPVEILALNDIEAFDRARALVTQWMLETGWSPNFTQLLCRIEECQQARYLGDHIIGCHTGPYPWIKPGKENQQTSPNSP